MFFYNLGVRAYQFMIHVASLFHPKAKLWVQGRKNWKKNLQEQFQKKQIQHPIWFHCASLGEFEQGRPLMEKIKQHHPDKKIILSFFSPSGYEIRKNYEVADLVVYLPSDTPTNAKEFIEILKPEMAIFVKYEFWLNYLAELKRKQIQVYLISAVIKKHQPFFKWYGSVFRQGLQAYTKIFTQDQVSLDLLKSLGVTVGVKAGDTRFDRVCEIASAPKRVVSAELFSKHKNVIIGGSTWPKDEELLLNVFKELKALHPDLKLMIAPHEIEESNIKRLIQEITNRQFSFHLMTDENNSEPADIFIVNTMGYLSSIYQYGQMAMIGGGFDDGIHNILEAAVYGLPVIFGPNYKKFNEAFDAISCGSGFSIENQEQLKQSISHLLNQSAYQQTSNQAKSFVHEHIGATEKILNDILQK